MPKSVQLLLFVSMHTIGVALAFVASTACGVSGPAPGAGEGHPLSADAAVDADKGDNDAGLDGSLSALDAEREAGVSCGATTCALGDVCLRETVSVGACPADASCTPSEYSRCQSIPATCDAAALCSCAALCASYCTCAGGLGSIDCSCAAP
jgi:hypothetical protein